MSDAISKLYPIDMDKHEEYIEWIIDKSKMREPYVYIQYKGTDICCDVNCSCGYHAHIDTIGLYRYACPKCKKVFALVHNVKLLEIPEEFKNKEYMFCPSVKYDVDDDWEVVDEKMDD